MKTNLEPLWKLVAKWEGEESKYNNLAVHQDFCSAIAQTYKDCMGQLARTLTRIEKRKPTRKK